MIGDKLKDRLGQPVVVENKPAAGGPPRPPRSRKSAPDGYAMLLGFNGPLAFGPLLQKLPYDVQKDLAPVIITSSQPNVLAVNAALPVNRRRTRRLCEGQPGQAQLRVRRQRQLVASQHGAAQVDGRLRRPARSVQRFAARGHGDDPGRDADDVRGDAAAAAADPGGQAPRDRGDDGEALSAASRFAYDRRIGLSGLRGARVERHHWWPRARRSR